MNARQWLSRGLAALVAAAGVLATGGVTRGALPNYRLEVFLPAPDGAGFVDYESTFGRILARRTFGAWDEGYVLFDAHPHAKLPYELHLGTAPKCGLFGADSRSIYTSEYYTSRVSWHHFDGSPPTLVTVGPWPTYMAFDARRWNLYVGVNNPNRYAQATIKVVDTVTNQLRPGGVTLNGAVGSSLLVSPDQRWLYVASLQPGLEEFYKIDISNPDNIRLQDVEQIPGLANPGFSISSDGTRAYVPDRNAGIVRILDTANLNQVGSWNLPGADGFWISPDGTHAIYQSFSETDMKVGIYDVAHGSVSQTFTFFESDIGNVESDSWVYPIRWHWEGGRKGAYLAVGAPQGGVAVFVLAVPGDATGDEYVGFADYQVLEGYFGTGSGANWMMGDSDGDGDVDFSDYQVLEANFGKGVPEPLSLSLLAAGSLLLIRRERS